MYITFHDNISPWMNPWPYKCTINPSHSVIPTGLKTSFWCIINVCTNYSLCIQGNQIWLQSLLTIMPYCTCILITQPTILIGLISTNNRIQSRAIWDKLPEFFYFCNCPSEARAIQKNKNTRAIHPKLARLCIRLSINRILNVKSVKTAGN